MNHNNHTDHTNHTNHNGMTLIELLIVMVFVVILSTFAISEYRGWRGMARDKKTRIAAELCQRAMKEFGDNVNPQFTTDWAEFTKYGCPTPEKIQGSVLTRSITLPLVSGRACYEIRIEHPNGTRNFCATEMGVSEADGLAAKTPATCPH